MGRRRMLALAAGAGLLSSTALALAPNLSVAIPAFLLFGIAPGVWMPAYWAALADLSTPEARSRAYAMPYAALGLGFTVGPLVGGLVAGWSYTVLYLGVAALFGLIGLFILVGLPETRPKRAGGEGTPAGRHVWRDGRFIALAGLIMAAWLIFGQIDITVPLWVIHHLHYPAAVFGVMMALNGLLIALGQIGLTSLSARRRASSALSLGAVCLGVGFGMLAIPFVPVLVAGSVVITLGEMLIVPTFNAALAALAPPDRRGQYQGGGQLMQGIGFALGPLIGGAVYQHWGGEALWPLCLVWGLACAGGFLLYGRWQPLEIQEDRRPAGEPDRADAEGTSAKAPA
jgi:MFS family permease